MGTTRESTQPDDESAAGQLAFEEALARLEGIVQALEEGSTGLAEGLAQYEEGVRLLKQCYAQLERAERRVELLTGVDAAGQPLSVPFDDAVEPLETKAQTRGQRRSRPARANSPPAGANQERVERDQDNEPGESESRPRGLFD